MPVVVALLLCGCALSERRPVEEAAEAAACRAFLAELDARVDAAGVRDAGAHRIDGFPWMRVDRFLSSFRTEVGTAGRRYEAWTDRLARLDRAARAREIANLPDALAGDAAARAGLAGRAAQCGDLLRDADTASQAARLRLIDAAIVPDAYRDWPRILGLYPLTRLFFLDGVQAWQRTVRAAFARPPSGRAELVAPVAGVRSGGETAGMILARAPVNPLGVPDPDDAGLERLFELHAPVYAMEVAGEHDRFGEVVPGAQAEPAVDVTRPVVYVRKAHARHGGATLLQLVYSAWFPERRPAHVLDLTAGRLQAVVWRVTLAPDGTPLVYDTMHGCGCYHLFFPTGRVEPRTAPGDLTEWMFSPAPAPVLAPGERIVLHLESGTHQVVRVSAASLPGATRAYSMVGDERLGSLPRADGARTSIFGPDGLVAGSARAERFLFWPMGIPSAGAMRQWGHHATAFVGRRHFDDPHLIEDRFRIIER